MEVASEIILTSTSGCNTYSKYKKARRKEKLTEATRNPLI